MSVDLIAVVLFATVSSTASVDSEFDTAAFCASEQPAALQKVPDEPRLCLKYERLAKAYYLGIQGSLDPNDVAVCWRHGQTAGGSYSEVLSCLGRDDTLAGTLALSEQLRAQRLEQSQSKVEQ